MSDSNWKEVPLADLVDLNPEALSNSTPSATRFQYIDISSVHPGVIDWQTVPECNFATAPSRARRIVRPKDSLFCTVRPSLQAHAYADWNVQDGYVCSTGFAVLRPSRSDSRFIFHKLFCDELATQVRQREVGSSYPAVNESELRQMLIAVPPTTEEQTRIAEILDTLDEAIREAEAVIAKLLQVKAGLLHDLLTRGLDENGHLRDPIRHPDQFQASPLGRFPKAWAVDELGKHLATKPRNGHSPLEASSFEGGYMLGLGCITPEGFSPRQIKFAPMGDVRLQSFKLEPGDVLLTRSNTRELVAAVGIFQDIGMPTFYPDLMMRLRPSASLNSSFLELVLRWHRVRSQLTNRANGTSGSMMKITSTDVQSIFVPVPSPDEQLAVVSVANIISQRLQSEQQTLAKLQSLKRGLSHELLTGRKRVKV